MKKLLSFSLLLFLINPINAQSDTITADEIKIRQTIDNLFNGMRTGDSAMVRSTFYPDARLVTCFTDREQKDRYLEDDLNEFITAVGTPHEESWNEIITSIEIQYDLNMAQVWTTYKFYLDDAFIHCGINAFQLIRENKEWKIMNLTDTRRKSDCELN